MLKLKSVYLVFYALLLELYKLTSTILYLEARSVNTMQEFSNNVYNIN
jgi:hypothetical protein